MSQTSPLRSAASGGSTSTGSTWTAPAASRPTWRSSANGLRADTWKRRPHSSRTARLSGNRPSSHAETTRLPCRRALNGIERDGGVGLGREA